MELFDPGATDDRPEARALLDAIRAALPDLEALLAETGDPGTYEDHVYRYYHQSWKVYGIQGVTSQIVAALQALRPARALNRQFAAIAAEGTGKKFAYEHNQRWDEVTRPMLEAFFHARFFLEMAVRYGKALEAPPALMPSGWAALLYLYDLR